MDINLKGYFSKRFRLKGKDWINLLPEEDKKAFLHYVNMHNNYGLNGGKVRARKAKRDHRGRFIRG